MGEAKRRGPLNVRIQQAVYEGRYKRMAREAQAPKHIGINYAWDPKANQVVLLFTAPITNLQLSPEQACQAVGFILEMTKRNGGEAAAKLLENFKWPTPAIPDQIQTSNS